MSKENSHDSFLHSEMSKHLDDHEKLLELVTESKVKLEEHAKDVETLKQDIANIKPSTFTVISVSASILVALAGGVWVLSNALSDRPTSDQVEYKINDKLKDLPDIRSEQIEQGRKLDKLEIILQDLSDDVKEIKAKRK